MKPLNARSRLPYRRQASLFLSQPRGCAGASPPVSFHAKITISESQKGGRIDLVSFPLSEDDIRRSDLLTAFGIMEGGRPAREEIINESSRLCFRQAYDKYRKRADPNDMMLRILNVSKNQNNMTIR